ncbi:MAG TPA: hypothetical protein VM535_01745 [Candidatus Saccharimonadales bacterium]|nr:hypothetical protein [Candidatus Saccharimonadales bacterium]
MNEARPQGPLDKVRELERVATVADVVVEEYLARNPEAYEEVIGQVRGLYHVHPLIGQEVGIHGVPLSVGMGEEEAMPYTLPVDRAKSMTYGLYNGLSVREIYDSERDEHGVRLVHMLYTGSDDPMLDEFGNTHQTHYYNYVCVPGSETVPVFPLNAHSLEDLADDPVVAMIDHIVLDEGANDLEKIQRLGREVNRVLKKREFTDNIEINHQRASYINSLGLHHNLRLDVRDFIVAADDSKDGDEFECISLDRRAHIIPQMFEIASGYDWVSGEEVPLEGGPPELYARTELPDGRPLMAALKNVLDARRMETDG